MSFFDFINSQHPNIKFTFEKQNDGKLSFLDVLINNSSHDCVFSVFHEKTYTGLLTNFFSFTPFRYKIGLIRTLIDRTYKINNTSSGFQNDLIKLSDTLKRNSFPSHIIDKTFKRYLKGSESATPLLLFTVLNLGSYYPSHARKRSTVQPENINQQNMS